ncbi:MAG: glycosyl transferase family 2 [Firmicutes bacterium HGW-Firmicutes-4]|jgi:cellulose synthase/poly-beta-1,6-N-acetylglucosamine synthase-like glycosyltransferase|nr:MAG: glycosyl transferase family 2 [Firmicutes bacterium HGW-Firmicutes-4]
MVLAVLKGYFIFSIVIILIYAFRHFIFAYNRAFGRQRLFYNDIIASDMPTISILIPMHNEEKVLKFALESLLECDYDRDRMEIIPINDNSKDKTKEMLDEYHSRYHFIRPLHRDCSNRGKPAGLNDAMKTARGEIIIVFDADYRPAKNMLNQLALAFLDPEVGAVMGRVIPYNTDKNLLTRLLNLERSGGYQADQQARYNLRLIPQYGGTVGGFRKSLMLESGGFDTAVLAEDTELTFRLYINGWKVVYANSAECYEEVPETWAVRAKQVRRWSRGHNSVCFRYIIPTILTKNMYPREKIDGILLLLVYAMPFMLALALLDSLALFFLGEMNVWSGWFVLLFVGAYNTYGNFAPFYEISSALIIDGVKKDVLLLPLLTFNFYFYLWNVSLGFLDAMVDLVSRRKVKWDKTVRFTEESGQVV